MKLEEILPEIRKGRRFRRTNWRTSSCEEDSWISANQEIRSTGIHPCQLILDDWELEPEKPKVLSSGFVCPKCFENLKVDIK